MLDLAFHRQAGGSRFGPLRLLRLDLLASRRHRLLNGLCQRLRRPEWAT
jgi:hypothetical protein